MVSYFSIASFARSFPPYLTLSVSFFSIYIHGDTIILLRIERIRWPFTTAMEFT